MSGINDTLTIPAIWTATVTSSDTTPFAIMRCKDYYEYTPIMQPLILLRDDGNRRCPRMGKGAPNRQRCEHTPHWAVPSACMK